MHIIDLDESMAIIDSGAFKANTPCVHEPAIILISVLKPNFYSENRVKSMLSCVLSACDFDVPIFILVCDTLHVHNIKAYEHYSESRARIIALERGEAVVKQFESGVAKLEEIDRKRISIRTWDEALVLASDLNKFMVEYAKQSPELLNIIESAAEKYCTNRRRNSSEESRILYFQAGLNYICEQLFMCAGEVRLMLENKQILKFNKYFYFPFTGKSEANLLFSIREYFPFLNPENIESFLMSIS